MLSVMPPDDKLIRVVCVCERVQGREEVVEIIISEPMQTFSTFSE